MLMEIEKIIENLKEAKACISTEPDKTYLHIGMAIIALEQQNIKASGIIRRIDDLGRIAIPKDVRRQCGIYEGEPLEIIPVTDGVFIKKYKPTEDRE